MNALEVVGYIALAVACVGALWGFLILIDAHRKEVEPHHDDD